ncbi:MobA/MobL family protein [uncultured Cycloclasticus sp.]|uniref:MobA/MobL family protein n=1 Tax=uncultured Cycloclasticus sp. TaxID=172194 RepID=UPI00258E4857|nr:MobA/MobL family protein [uncultured Cycloclasticus sp.]
MAIYHQHIKAIQRSKGKSAVAAAAYRSASLLRDKRTGEVHDYTKKERVDFSSIIGWLDTREALWNTAESTEKRKDATTAREYEVSLPIELHDYQQQSLATQYGLWLHKEYGVVVDLNIHNIGSLNSHAHILTTTRMVENERTLTDKSPREWSGTRRVKAGLISRKLDLIAAREKWAQLCNTALKDAGHDERIDHRTYADQGILIPPQIHVGVHALAEHKKTGSSERVEKNDEIIARQKKARELIQEKELLQNQISLLKFHQFLLHSKLNSEKINYYVAHFSIPENDIKEPSTTAKKNHQQAQLNAWGFPIEHSHSADEYGPDWGAIDEPFITEEDYLYTPDMEIDHDDKLY